MPIEAVAVTPKAKHTMLPLLVVLFLISYGLMAMLVVEQSRTIDTQRSLIRQLFSDSTELSHLKGDAFQKQRAEAQAQAQAKAHSQVKTPSTQATPAAPEKATKQSTGKVRKPDARRPSREASQPADERRSLVSI